MKKCPYCAEDIQDEAIKCRYCGEFLHEQQRETALRDYLPPNNQGRNAGQQSDFVYSVATDRVRISADVPAHQKILLYTSLICAGFLVLTIIIIFSRIWGLEGSALFEALFKRQTSSWITALVLLVSTVTFYHIGTVFTFYCGYCDKKVVHKFDGKTSLEGIDCTHCGIRNIIDWQE